MQPFSIVHEYESSPQAFWTLFFDDAYNRAFYASVDIDFEVVRDELEGGRRERVVRYRSRKPVPGLMRPFMPEGLGYTEHGVFDVQACELAHRIEPSAFASRTDIRGTLRVADIGQGRIRRSYAGTVSIRAPLIARKLELDTVANMVSSQDTAATVTRHWLAQSSAKSAFTMSPAL